MVYYSKTVNKFQYKDTYVLLLTKYTLNKFFKGDEYMFCPKCGQNLENGIKFCTKCGYDMTSAQVEQPVSQAAPQPPVSQAPPQMPPPTAANPPKPDPVSLDKPMSVLQYLGMFVLLAIPILGIILVFKWAFGKSVNTNKRNYSRAVLIMFLIMFILSIVFSVIYGSILMSYFKAGSAIPLN
jgi:hypothetical protein